MKRFNLSLFILSLVIGASSPLWAADATQESTNYQSSLDDYKPLSDDNLSDWKSINMPSNSGGHDGHSMAGMQHSMTPERMANMPSESKESPTMEGMDHSGMDGMKKVAPDNMQGMDHSQMKHDHPMPPIAEMDHSKMAGMDHKNMKSMPVSKSAVQSMKKEEMLEMDHSQMSGNDHNSTDMEGMNHSRMSESKSSDMQPYTEGAIPGDSKAPDQASAKGAEHAGMYMPSTTPAVQASSWQIIPNFHPVVVHFPIALTIIAFLLSIASHARRSHPISGQLAAAGHFVLWLAAISAVTAVLFGWLAYNSISNHDDAGHAAMLLHRSWAVPTAIGLVLLASWDAWKYRVTELISVPMLFLLFLLSQAIAVTGWLGGEAVYRHGIGVLSTPTSGTSHANHGNVNINASSQLKNGEHTDMNHDPEGESHEH